MPIGITCRIQDKIDNADIDKVKDLYNKLDYKEQYYTPTYEYKSK